MSIKALAIDSFVCLYSWKEIFSLWEAKIYPVKDEQQQRILQRSCGTLQFLFSATNDDGINECHYPKEKLVVWKRLWGYIISVHSRS